MKNTSVNDNIINIAANELSITGEEIRQASVESCGGLCLVTLLTAFQRHELYINPHSSELLGLSSEPCGEGLYELYGHYCG